MKRTVVIKLLKDELLADIEQQGSTKKRPPKVAPLTKKKRIHVYPLVMARLCIAY